MLSLINIIFTIIMSMLYILIYIEILITMQIFILAFNALLTVTKKIIMSSTS